MRPDFVTPFRQKGPIDSNLFVIPFFASPFLHAISVYPDRDVKQHGAFISNSSIFFPILIDAAEFNISVISGGMEDEIYSLGIGKREKRSDQSLIRLE